MTPSTNPRNESPPIAQRRERALVIASNRGPITVQSVTDGQVYFERGSGGVVTALLGLAQQIDATWIACARTDADAAWGAGEIQLADTDRSIRVKFLAPAPGAFDQYYNVIANPLLWFLQHAMWAVPREPIIDRTTWRAWEDGYQVVNHLFATTIAQTLRAIPCPAVIMLQDYHLYLVARDLRQQLRLKPKHALLHFIHIPWPGSTYMRILPGTMRHAILDSLCAVDLLGFQTRDDSLNFLRSCESFLPGAHVNTRRGRVWYRNHMTHVRDFPISIDVAALRQTADSPAVAEFRAELQALIADAQLIVRVDRIEPRKNIVRGFRAF